MKEMANQIYAFGKLHTVAQEDKFRFSIRRRPEYFHTGLRWATEVRLLETADGQHILVVRNPYDMIRVWLYEYAHHDPAGLAEEVGDIMPMLISSAVGMSYTPEITGRALDFFLQKFEDHEEHGGTYILLGQYGKYMVDKWKEWR